MTIKRGRLKAIFIIESVTILIGIVIFTLATQNSLNTLGGLRPADNEYQAGYCETSIETPAELSSDVPNSLTNFEPDGDSHTHVAETIADINTAQFAVLLYHHIADDDKATVTPAIFEEQMRALYEAGYTSLSINDLYEYVYSNKCIPEHSFFISFDDGYLSNYENAFPVLQKYNFHATIFIIGATFGADTYKDRETPIIPHFNKEQAREMVDSGLVSIQSHTYDMHQLPEYEADPIKGVLRREGEAEMDYLARFQDDYEKEDDLIRRITGENILAFAYPFGIYDRVSEALLDLLGIKITFTTEPGMNTLIQGSPISLRGLHRYAIDDSVTLDELLQLMPA